MSKLRFSPNTIKQNTFWHLKKNKFIPLYIEIVPLQFGHIVQRSLQKAVEQDKTIMCDGITNEQKRLRMQNESVCSVFALVILHHGLTSWGCYLIHTVKIGGKKHLFL